MNRWGDNLICTGANEDVVRAFVANDVEFILVGGLAVSWYCDARTADDMDLVVDPTPENSQRVHRALLSLSVTDGHDGESFAKPGVQAPLKQFHHADVLTPATADPTFAEIAESTVPAKLFGIPIRIPTIPMLVRLKECVIAANSGDCSKHVADIELLIQRDAR